MAENKKLINPKTWQDFRDCGLFWWVNRSLHLFGWAIVFEVDASGAIIKVFPARCKFRGFAQEIESEEFVKLHKYIRDNAEDLLDEASK